MIDLSPFAEIGIGGVLALSLYLNHKLQSQSFAKLANVVGENTKVVASLHAYLKNGGSK